MASEVKFVLPGSETVTISGQTIDKLIRAGDGDAALLYLYILKTHGQKTSSEAAIALDKSKGWVASAMAVLSRLGLVRLDNNEETDTGAKPAGTSGCTQLTCKAMAPSNSKAPEPIALQAGLRKCWNSFHLSNQRRGAC